MKGTVCYNITFLNYFTAEIHLPILIYLTYGIYSTLINGKRQILELNEKLETMQSEKTQLVVQLNSKQPDCNSAKKTTPQKNKIADQRRLKIKELEAQMANLQK